jgi:hypothetical protein
LSADELVDAQDEEARKIIDLVARTGFLPDPRR